jgi:hypothetical protein
VKAPAPTALYATVPLSAFLHRFPSFLKVQDSMLLTTVKKKLPRKPNVMPALPVKLNVPQTILDAVILLPVNHAITDSIYNWSRRFVVS